MRQEPQLGTGHAVQQAAPALPATITRPGVHAMMLLAANCTSAIPLIATASTVLTPFISCTSVMPATASAASIMMPIPPPK